MAAWLMVVDAGRPGHSRLKLTSSSPTRPVPFLEVSGSWRQSLPIYPSASQRCVSCFRAFAVPLPACGLKLGQMFPELLRLDVSLLPQEAGVSRCYKKEGSWVEGCVILSCRGKQVCNISGRTETRELWGWWQPGLSLLRGMFQGHFLLILSLPAPTSFPLLVSTLGPLLAASWVCCLGALVCLSEDWPRTVSLPAGRTPPVR